MGDYGVQGRDVGDEAMQVMPECLSMSIASVCSVYNDTQSNFLALSPTTIAALAAIFPYMSFVSFTLPNPNKRDSDQPPHAQFFVSLPQIDESLHDASTTPLEFSSQVSYLPD